jgi:ribosomal protein L14E/L6E/L27E
MKYGGFSRIEGRIKSRKVAVLNVIHQNPVVYICEHGDPFGSVEGGGDW